MAFEITSDTIVKILIRRGEEFDRKLTLLTNGELGYSQDIKRLFIGDGVTLGGNPISNLFLGAVADRGDVTEFAHTGDLVFQTTNNRLYVYDENFVDEWYNIHPYFNERVFSEAGGEWYLDSNLFAAGFSYNPVGGGNSITGAVNTIDFNKSYISLSAAFGSFYFGDLDIRPPGLNNLDATVNIAETLFINSLDNPYNQIQIHAKELDGASVIRGERGSLYLQGQNEVSLLSNNFKVVETVDGSYVKIHNAVAGTYATPNFIVYGNSRFVDNVNCDSNVTVTGNLSVYGDVSYFETFVTATSSLSVINWSQDQTPALNVRQNFPGVDQPIALFYGNPAIGGNRWPVLTIKDGPFVGIGTGPGSTRGTLNNVVFAVSGGALFNKINATDRFEVFTGNGGITLNADDGGTGDFRSYIGSTYNLQTLGLQSMSAANYILNSTDPSSAALRIFTRATTSAKPGLQIDSSNQVSTGVGNGLWFIPSSNAGSYNRLTQANDSVIVARNLSGPDAGSNVGLVIGLHDSAGNTKGIRIAADGDVGIGIADPGIYKLNVAGQARIGSSLRVEGAINATGDIIAFVTSDKQLKRDIYPITDALYKINQISGVNFNWNTEKQTDYTGSDVGVIAQEIETVLPEVVTTRDNGYKAVRYEKIVPLLIEAIKDLSRQVEILKNK